MKAKISKKNYMSGPQLEWGPVVVEDWFDELRIGYYDDDDVNEKDEDCAVVFMGDMFLAMSIGHHMIPHEFLRPVTTADLWNRREAIYSQIARNAFSKEGKLSYEDRFRLLLELGFVDGVLMDR